MSLALMPASLSGQGKQVTMWGGHVLPYCCVCSLDAGNASLQGGPCEATLLLAMLAGLLGVWWPHQASPDAATSTWHVCALTSQNGKASHLLALPAPGLRAAQKLGMSFMRVSMSHGVQASCTAGPRPRTHS